MSKFNPLNWFRGKGSFNLFKVLGVSTLGIAGYTTVTQELVTKPPIEISTTTPIKRADDYLEEGYKFNQIENELLTLQKKVESLDSLLAANQFLLEKMKTQEPKNPSVISIPVNPKHK